MIFMVKVDKFVNLAVIGTGYWGRKVAREYIDLAKTDPDFNLAKVCDLDEANLTFCQENLNVNPNQLCSNFSEILNSPEINAVHICTPNDTHYSFGLNAITAGKNVLLEKPMSLTSSHAMELVTTAQSRNLCLQVGHIYRFNNAIKKIKDLVNDNFFGDLYYLKLQWTIWMISPTGRDIIFDLGPHPIDIMNYILEKWPRKVVCSANSYRRPSLEEVAYIHMDFGDKLMAHVELSWLQPGKARELSIIGSKRSAIVDCLSQKITIFEDNNENNYNIEIRQNNTIFDEVSHFVNSIRNENNHRNPGSVGAENVVILESLRKSLEEERIVKVELNNL
jgi:UDP-N-acetylglucosamine 3-dehydrogenase